METTRLQAYGPRSLAYTGIRQTSNAERATATQAPAQSATLHRSADTADLTSAETQMIDRYFPASPTLSMRLYGPGNASQTVTPQALGARLDLRG